jgi:ABC-type sugar transport system ATPase subunit
MPTTPVCELRAVTKEYPGVRALDVVDLALYPGELHGLAGENGAGKSTLVRIVSGAEPPDAGEVILDGRPRRFASPHEAIAAGISVVHQELALAPHLTVTENVLLGRLPSSHGLVRWREAHLRAKEALDRLDVDINVRAKLGDLSLGRQQLVEIARALERDARIVILDEPSAMLGRHDLEVLFGTLRALKARGVACLYISHRLHELFELADRVTVLKDGKRVATHPIGELDVPKLVTLMTGRELAIPSRRTREDDLQPLLQVEGLGRDGAFDDVSFSVRSGEIVGMAGLVGAGRTEIARAIAGAEPAQRGVIRLRGRVVDTRSPRSTLRRRIGLVPEDRKDQGLLLNRSIRENVGLASLAKRSVFGVIRHREDRENVLELAGKVDLRYRNLSQHAIFLSGGNQQKAMLARWLAADCELLILDEPTRGVDVGGKSEIYALMRLVTAQGVGILMISSEIEEIVAMSDRVVVMREGRLVSQFAGDEIDEDHILRAALVHSVADTDSGVAT